MADGIEVARAFVTIIPKTDGTAGNVINKLAMPMGQGADKAGILAGRKFTAGFGSTIARFAGTAAIGSMLKKSISEGANLEQAIGGIETLFKSSSDEMIKNADRAFKTAGISATKYMEQATSFSASLLQATGGDTEKAAKAADQAIIDMSDNANKMGSNIADIQHAYQGFAKQNYTMLDNLKLGYGGTKTEMERLLADAEKLSGKEYDISSLSDVYEAIHVIQTELDITGTSSEEAATTLSGSFASMKAAMDNLMGDLALGRNIGPAMEGLAETASTFLFNNLIPAIGNVITSLPVAIGTFIQTGLPQFAAAGTQLVQSLIDGAQTALPGMIANLMNSLTSMSESFASGMSSFIDMGLTLVKNIADGIIKNIPVFIATVPQIITNLANIINTNAPKVIETGATILKNLAVGLVKAIPVLVENIPQIIKAAVAVFTAFQWANVGKMAVKAISKGLSAGISVVKAAGKKIANGIVNAIKSAPSKVSSAVSKIKSHLGFSGAVAKVKSVFERIKNGMMKPIEKAKDKIKGIIEKIKGFFPISIGKWLSNLPSLHINTATKTFLGKTITYPTGFSWNAKAMQQPYMFTDATLFGAGEAGDEVLYGRKALMRDIAEVAGGSEPAAVYNIGDITLDVSSLEDIATLEDFVRIATRAKRFK